MAEKEDNYIMMMCEKVAQIDLEDIITMDLMTIAYSYLHTKTFHVRLSTSDTEQAILVAQSQVVTSCSSLCLYSRANG